MPPITVIPCHPDNRLPYGEINDYCWCRLAPDLRRLYRPAGRMAPGSWLFSGAPADVPRGIVRATSIEPVT